MASTTPASYDYDHMALTRALTRALMRASRMASKTPASYGDGDDHMASMTAAPA
jgi:hypothetical protein